MNKNDKPIERKLARGSLLPEELIGLLTRAATDATYTSIRVNWSDDHSTRVSNIDELAPIEDVENVDGVHASFEYEDRSELTIELNAYFESKIAALGRTARTRQSALCEYWAIVPGRARISERPIGWLLRLGLLLPLSGAVLGLFALLTRDIRTSPTAVLIVLSYFLLAVCAAFFIRSLASVKAFGHIVVLNRHPRRDVSKIVSGVVGIAGLAMVVIAYLYPRN
jgi:hypothetical protein